MSSTKSKNDNKQLNIFMALTKSLLSNDESKNVKRAYLAQKITSTIMNNRKFSSYLQMPSTLSIQQQLTSIHCQIAQRCIKLLQHRDEEIHNFAKSLFFKLTTNNDTLTNIVLVIIFNVSTNIMPKSLITLTNNQNIEEKHKEMDILSQLRAITVIMDRIYIIFKNKPSFKHTYSQKLNALELSFNFLMFSLCTNPALQTTTTQSPFSLEPYKLPSIKIQIILIHFWSKYPLLRPNDIFFRTLYLIRWLVVFECDYLIDGESTITKLVNIISFNFNPNHIDNNSESVLCLFTLLGFLGNSSIAICDSSNNQKRNVTSYRLLERMPIKLRNHLKNSLNEIIQKLGIDKMQIIISSMFEWPQTQCVYEWILTLLTNIEQNGYFNLLCELCIHSTNKIAVQLKEGNKRNNLNGAMCLLQYLLYGFRRSAVAFHNVILSLIEGIYALESMPEYEQKLFELIELCHILIFRWPGYPNEYYSICAILHRPKYKKMEPNDQRIRHVLNKYEWKAKRQNIGNNKSMSDYNKSSSAKVSKYGQYSSNISFAPAKRCAITNKAGLTNLGATCYMNSIIQALYLSHDFRIKLMKLTHIKYDKNAKMDKKKWEKIKEITLEIQRIFGHLKYTKRQCVSTRTLVNLLPSPWTAGRQQDASEFAKYLLDLLWETIRHCVDYKVYCGEGQNDFDPLFGGLQENNIKCRQCGNVSARKECFTEIALSMHQNKEDEHKELCTKEMIAQHFGVEVMKDENKYFCDECKDKVEAERYTQIVCPSQHLVICFKRFSWNYDTMKRMKKNDWVNCPLTLDIPIKDEKVAKYVLYAAVIHSGRSAEFGHYYTIGRESNDMMNRSGQWFMFNDRRVTMSDYEKLCKVSRDYTTDVPYLLFYKLMDDGTNKVKNEEQCDGKVNDSEWENKVNEDNSKFEQELAKYTSR